MSNYNVCRVQNLEKYSYFDTVNDPKQRKKRVSYFLGKFIHY
jgi:hypothetical protein